MLEKVKDIIWNKENEIEERLQQLEQQHEDKEIYTSSYLFSRDVLEAKLRVLEEVVDELTKISNN